MDILGFGLVGTAGLIKYLVFVGGVAGGCTLLVLLLLRGRLGAAPMQWLLRVPVVGGCLRTSALSRLAWTLSLALDSGVDARRSMRLALRATQNAYYTSRMETVDAELLAGHEFHEALRATGLFPEEFLDQLQTAEISGTHAETLEQVAKDYRTRA